MGTDGYDPSIVRSLLPETRNEQDFTKTGELAVRACVRGTFMLLQLLDVKLEFVVLAARKEAQHSLCRPPCLRAASNCVLSYGVSLTGSAVLQIDRDV